MASDTDHFTSSEEALRRADEWANRDNVPSQETRDHMIDYNLSLAGIHAMLANAQATRELAGLFETGRASVAAYNPNEV
jgi:hypothetical protein